MEEFLIMGEFTHSWNHVGEFSAKRVTTSSFAGTTKPILLGKKKKIIILLIPQNLASAAESFVFPSSSCLGYISCLPPLPDVGPHVKITQGMTLEAPNLGGACHLAAHSCRRPPSLNQQYAGHAERGELCCCFCCCCKCWRQSLHLWWDQPAVVLC